MALTIECLHVGEYGMNCYLVEDPATREVFIVDPGADGERIIEAVGERKPKAVLLTHGHYDHIGAVDAVCGHFGIPVYIHELDAPKLRDPALNVSVDFTAPTYVQTEPTLLRGGEVLHLGDAEITVLHTPGHSAGGVSYLLPDGQGVLSGDTLFAHGYGRTDFVDGDFHALRQSLRLLLFDLHPKQIAYPGHEDFGMAGRGQ